MSMPVVDTKTTKTVVALGSNRIVLALVLVHSRVIVVSVDVDEDVDDEGREEAPRALTSRCGCSE